MLKNLLFTTIFFLLISATIPAQNQEQPKTENLLSCLVGTWEFKLGRRSGTREIKALYGDYSVEYLEKFDQDGIEAKGFIIFNAEKNQYLSLGLHNRPGTGGAGIGTPDGKNKIVFRPSTKDEEQKPTESWLIIDAKDKFRYVLRQQNPNGEWQVVWEAVFTRK